MSVSAPVADKAFRCPTCRAEHACGTGCKLFISAECPVCLETCDPFVSLPCKHGVCAECFPRLAYDGRSPLLAQGDVSSGENVVLDEAIDENWEPTDAEVREYAVWLGMSLPADDVFLYIAREGLKAPLPPPWKPCKTGEGEIFYFNFSTGESVWDHPCDEFYRNQYATAKSHAQAQAQARAEAEAQAEATARAQAIAEMDASMDTFMGLRRQAKTLTRKAELGDVAAALGEARKLLETSKAAAQLRAARGAGEPRRRSVERRHPALDQPPATQRTLPPIEGGPRRLLHRATLA